jgi:very-short-patch-repair endonuclease
MTLEQKIQTLAKLRDQFCRDCCNASPPEQSPIEATFSWAMACIFEEIGGGQTQENEPATLDELDDLGYNLGHTAPFHTYVFSQVKIDRYRVDFLLAHRNGGDTTVRFAVIECDGHDFHERTKKQAEHDKKRDRRLQELGYPVLRVTGSEIWRSPVKTAFDVYVSALKAMGARS